MSGLQKKVRKKAVKVSQHCANPGRVVPAEDMEPDPDSDHCEHDISPPYTCRECRERDESE